METGEYIEVNGKHAKIIKIDSPTLMTVKWIPAWQWFFISKWAALRSHFTSFRAPGLWWFRVFGIGLAWKDIRVHPMTFSQRNGYSGLRVGWWLFEILEKPCHP